MYIQSNYDDLTQNQTQNQNVYLADIMSYNWQESLENGCMMMQPQIHLISYLNQTNASLTVINTCYRQLMQNYMDCHNNVSKSDFTRLLTFRQTCHATSENILQLQAHSNLIINQFQCNHRIFTQADYQEICYRFSEDIRQSLTEAYISKLQ